MAIEEYLRRHAAQVDAALAAWVRERKDRVEPRLLEAMEYSLVSPGKRMRPVLVLAAVEAAGADPTSLASYGDTPPRIWPEFQTPVGGTLDLKATRPRTAMPSCGRRSRSG